MEIVQLLCPESKYSIKCPYTMVPEGITFHNTANDASAKNEVSYMISNNNQVSFHWAVDDISAVQGIPHDRNTWNAGDGSNGFGNRKTISIEICYSKSGGDRFHLAEQNAAELIARLMLQYNWTTDLIGTKIINTHQSRNGKYCPHRTLDEGIGNFYDMIRTKYEELSGQPVPVPQPEPQPEPTPEPSGNLTIKNYQHWLNVNYGVGLDEDGYYGPKTKKGALKGYQTQLNKDYGAGLSVDGIWGPRTKRAVRVLSKGSTGNQVHIIQGMLVCRGYNTNGVDGIYGSGTKNAVYSFQKACYPNDKRQWDGIYGKNTGEKLFA